MILSKNLKFRVACIVMASSIMIGSFTNPSFAASGQVKVTLPNFKVTLNGMAIENNNKKYPLIVYKNITYFPMTYYDCRFLGLETEWDGKKLSVKKDQISGAYYDDKASKMNNTTYMAGIQTFSVAINGKTIKNDKQTYPLLNFRDVTYFPLTWDYGAVEFGWDYSFDNQKGLIINSGIIPPKTVIIPDPLGGGFTVSAGYLYYYDGARGKIMAINLKNTKDLIEVHQFEKIKFLDKIQYPAYNVWEKNGEGYFSMVIQEDPMKFQLYKVDGKMKKLVKVESGLDTFGNVSIFVDDAQKGTLNNLFVQKNGGEKTNIGDSKLHYLQSLGLVSGKEEGKVFLSGDEVVLIANDGSSSGENQLCKVNINTGKHTTLLKSITTSDIRVDGGYVYLIAVLDENRDTTVLKKINIADGTIIDMKTLTETSMKSEVFAVKNNHIFYQNGFDLGRPPLHVGPSTPEYEKEFQAWAKRVIPDQSLYEVGNSQSLNKGAIVSDLSVQGEYVLCTFNDQNNKGEPSKYGLMVFDKNGKIVFKTADKVSQTYVDHNTLVYTRYDNIDGSYINCEIYLVEL